MIIIFRKTRLHEKFCLIQLETCICFDIHHPKVQEEQSDRIRLCLNPSPWFSFQLRCSKSDTAPLRLPARKPRPAACCCSE